MSGYSAGDAFKGKERRHGRARDTLLRHGFLHRLNVSINNGNRKSGPSSGLASATYLSRRSQGEVRAIPEAACAGARAREKREPSVRRRRRRWPLRSLVIFRGIACPREMICKITVARLPERTRRARATTRARVTSDASDSALSVHACTSE